MSEMVERVARAICEYDYVGCDFPACDCTSARGQAVAAIHAMRPTPEMLAAAWKAFRGDRTGQLMGPGPGFREAMDAMIDAALGRETPP